MYLSEEEKIIVLWDKRIQSLVDDAINLILKGEYRFSSSLQNKVLFYYLRQFIIPSVGQRIANLFFKYLSHLEENDVRHELTLVVLQLIDKYKPNKKRRRKDPLSIYGYISYMLPYMVKRIIDNYLFVYYLEERLDRKVCYSFEYIEDDHIPLCEMNFKEMINLLCGEMGYTSKDLSEQWLVNAASIRRRKSK